MLYLSFANTIIIFFMGRPGFEPETNRLKAECSTAELATRVRISHAFSRIT